MEEYLGNDDRRSVDGIILYRGQRIVGLFQREHGYLRLQPDLGGDFEEIARVRSSHICHATDLPLAPQQAGVIELWNPVEMDCSAATLDVSHAAVSGSDVLEMAVQLGSRLAHVHLGDGTKPGLPDEHLVPGRGTQPCAELLRWLTDTGYSGHVVLEVSTHRVPTLGDRQADLAESLDFARRYLAGARPAGAGTRS